MRKDVFALFMVAILLPVGWSESAGAWHTDPDLPEADDLPEAPQLPEEPPTETGIIPVDRELRDAARQTEPVNRVVNESYRIVSSVYSGAYENVSQTVDQPLTIYQDGTGGFEASEPADRRYGGFGDWRVLGTPAWGPQEDAASTGESGITTSTLPEGRYPGHADSLLVSPEIDLRTNFFMERNRLLGELFDELGVEMPDELEDDDFQEAWDLFWETEDDLDWCPAQGFHEPWRTPYCEIRDSVKEQTVPNPGDIQGGPLVSSVYTAMYFACDVVWWVWNAPRGTVSNPPQPYDTEQCAPYRALIDHEHLYSSLEFSFRHNLAEHPASPDSVQVMVFTEPPPSIEHEIVENCAFSRRPETGVREQEDGSTTTHPLRDGGPFEDGMTNMRFRSLDQPCQIVRPKTGPADFRMSPGMNLTGFADWTRGFVDLTQWEGQSVWVGFRFQSGAIVNPDVYFDGSNRFNTDEDFRGFHLDDLEVKIPAAAVNVAVKPLLEPSFQPPGAARPTLDPEQPVPVKAYVSNLATESRDVTVVTRILHGDSDLLNYWTLVGEEYEVLHHERLGPVEHLEIDLEFNLSALDRGLYVAHVCVYRDEAGIQDASGGDMDYCTDQDNIPRADDPDLRCSNDPLEADPCNQFESKTFRLRPVSLVSAGDLQRSTDRIDSGGQMTLQMPITNDGNAPEEIEVRAEVYNRRTGTCAGGACIQLGGNPAFEFHEETPHTRTVTVNASQTVNLEWSVLGSRSGHYVFFVQVGDAPGFQAEYDLLPRNLQPWEALPVEPDASDSIFVSDTLWDDYPSYPLGNGETTQVAYNDTHLFLRLNRGDDPFTLFLNDNDDGEIGSGGGGVGFRYDGGGEDIGLHFDEGWRLLPADTVVENVSAGFQHSLLVTVDGKVFAWGSGANGRLGQGESGIPPSPISSSSVFPRQVTGLDVDVISVSAGGDHSLALTVDGEVFSWGRGSNGRLGNGEDEDRGVPVLVLGLEDDTVDAVSAGGDHSLALTEDGRVFSWGFGGNGRLGLGNTTSQDRALPVVGLEDETVGAVSAGWFHSLALTEDGRVFSWGLGSNGRLGLGNMTDQNRALPVVGLEGENVIAIAAGGHHSVALTDDGAVFTWGRGFRGALGTGDDNDQTRPIQVVGLEGRNVVAISSTGVHTLALTEDGTVYSWGRGEEGQLGNGGRADSNVPVTVARSPDVGAWEGVKISAGGFHSFAMTSYNMTLGWGNAAQRDADGNIIFRLLGNNLANDALYPRFTLTRSNIVNELFTILHSWDGVEHRFQNDDISWVELVLPVNRSADATGPGLTVGPGGALGIALRLCTSLAPVAPGCADHPHAAPVYDGDGFHAPDGDLGNELRQWRTIRLIEPSNVEGFTHRALSAPFAVGTDAPPYYFEDFEGGAECPLFLGWAHSIQGNILSNAVSMNDRWHCGDYPDDGRVLLYKGMGPCVEGDCEVPYSQGRPATATGEYSLWSPPIEIPHDARSPTLVLTHQYSTEVQVDDLSSSRSVDANHQPRVHVEEWNEDEGQWVSSRPLEPEGGYTTEERAGIADPRFTRNHPDQHWWWPQGDQPRYHPLDQRLATGGEFHGGSPWTTDRIPLYGSTSNGDLLNLAGSTIRLHFDFEVTSDASSNPDRDHDWGWRIGGLAVIDENEDGDVRFGRDLMIESVVPRVGFDPYEIGFGPGTNVTFDVTVRNDGSDDVLWNANNHRVLIYFDDLDTGETFPCGVLAGVGPNIGPGNVHTFRLDCEMPDSTGTQFALRVALDLGSTGQARGHDDFLANHQQRVPGTFELLESPRFELRVGATPRVDLADTERRFVVTIENTGNVPIEGVNVTRTISRVTDDGLTAPQTKQWDLRPGESVPIGQDLTLSIRNVVPEQPRIDLWDPPRTGTFLAEFITEVTMATGPPIRERSVIRLEAFEEIYTDDFDGSPSSLPGVAIGNLTLDGTSDVWQVQTSNRGDGSMVMRAGDPGTGDIPANASAMVRLPTLDLGAVKRATLVFDHRYDLEILENAGFDAGRVEMSLDGGDTWHAVIPEPHPCMPMGYPSNRLVGLNAILQQSREVELFAGAFTGKSEACEAADEFGWVTSEIDLTRQPAFWAEEPIETFPLDGLASEARSRPLNFVVKDPIDQVDRPDWRFTHPSWFLDEEGAAGRERYWWINDATYSEPRPLTDGTMWWSGTAGEADPGHELDPQDTRLTYTIDPADWENSDGLVLSFWDWRAGWRDTDGSRWEGHSRERQGTGGLFEVLIDGVMVSSQNIEVGERRADGWTKREVDLGPSMNGDPLEVEFKYRTGRVNDFRVSGESSSNPWYVYFAETQNNRGWFIDSVSVVDRAGGGEDVPLSDTLGGLDRNAECGQNLATGNWTSWKLPSSTICWSLVGVGDTARDHGWYLEPVEVPGRGTQTAWRFSDDSQEGYPANADSRLVMPKVDLTTYSGDQVALSFEHSYEFHGKPHFCRIHEIQGPYPVSGWDMEESCNTVDVGRAVDAGMVTYQVYDELTGTWGSWQPLHGMGEDPEVGFIQRSGQDWVYVMDPPVMTPEGEAKSKKIKEFLNIRQSTAPGLVDDLRGIGYPAIMHFPSTTGGGLYGWQGGLGASLPQSEAWIRGSGSWQPYSVAYVFSNQNDWALVHWDISHLIGNQVRFAFHAWTNPSGEPCDTGEVNHYRMGWSLHSGDRGHLHGRGNEGFCDDDRSLDGWTIANVALHGQRFHGQEVDLRFHLATDESNTKGEWSIGNVRLVGERYGRSVVFESDEPHVLDEPGSLVTLEGSVRNLGAQTRSDLAIVMDVWDAEADAPLADEHVTLLADGSPLEIIDNLSVLPDWVEHGAHGPFRLFTATTDAEGSVLPLRLEIQLPDSDSQVEVDLQLLELATSCSRVGDDLVCTENYRPVVNERGSPLPRTTWIAEGRNLLDFQLAPALEDRDDRLVADPMIVPLENTTRLKAKAVNEGTLDGPVNAVWTVQEVIRKGCPQDGSQCAQQGTQEILGDATTHTESLQTGRGEEISLEFPFTPSSEGLHRATLRIVEPGNGGEVLDEAVTEFIGGTLEPYYFVDFGVTNATDDGWTPGSPQRGTSVPALQFRQMEGQFIWGVNRTQFHDQGIHYCDERVGASEGCNPQVNTYGSGSNPGDAPNNPAYGLEGVAESPIVDLGQVIGNSATLTLRNDHLFQTRDGAVVEAMPMTPNQRPAFFCTTDEGDRRAGWVRLYPEPEELYPGLTRGYGAFQLQTGAQQSQAGWLPVFGWAPPRYNSLDLDPPRGSPVIGGDSVESQTIRFRLEDASPEWVCPSGFNAPTNGNEVVEPPESLLNYTVQFRLRTGTVPLSVQNQNCNVDWSAQFNGHTDNRGRCSDPSRTTGGMGWQIDGLGITAVGVNTSPSERHLPILDGYPKLFGFHVINVGDVEETFRITIQGDPEDPIRDWITLPQTEVRLLPGERRVVPFHVDIPADADQERGSQNTLIRATSTLDPGIFDEVLVVLDLLDQNLPDLELQLAVTEGQEAVPIFEAGARTETVVATIANRGHAASEEVPISIQLVWEDEEGEEIRRPVFTGMVRELCPLTQAECEESGGGRYNLENFAFTAPEVPGDYVIEAVVDPEGRLVQESVTNSRASMKVKVIPLQIPNLALSGLHLGGVREDGYALHGTTVRIMVNVTNEGAVPASGTLVNLMVGGAHIIENRPIPTLLPGQTHQVFANLSGLSPGEVTIRAFVFHELDPDTSNTEIVRVLRVRGLDLILNGPPEPVALSPGQTTTTRIGVHNDGNAVEQVRLDLGGDHAEWGFAATPNPVTVAPNATAWSIVTLQAPGNATAGTYDLDVIGAPLSQPTAWQEVPLPVQVAAHLDAPAVSAQPSQATPGPAQLRVDLESRSNAPQNLTLRLEEPDWGTRDVTVTLRPNNAARVVVPLTVPPYTSPDEYPVFVTVHNETGAQVAGTPATIRVLPKADATAHWEDEILAPETDLVTRLFQVPLNVTNTGNVPFTPETVVTGLTEGAEYKPAGPPSVIEPGDSAWIPIPLQVNAEFTKRIQGEVEVYIHVNHTNPSGNASVDPVHIARLPLPDLAALPDLEISDVNLRPRSGISVGENVRITVTVRNSGFVDAPASLLHAYVDGEFVEAVPITGLAPNEAYEVNLTWAFPGSGQWLVQLQADGLGEVTELYEDNNGWTRVLDVESGGFGQRIQEAPAPPPILAVLLTLMAAIAIGLRRGRQQGGQA